jgi:uncharacterized protein (TIGR02246 family)
MKRLLAVSLFLFGVNGAGWAAAADLQVEADTIRDLNKSWVAAVQAKDAASITGLQAPDAVLMPANAAQATGRDAVGEAWKGLLAMPNLALTFAPATVHVADSADMAYEIGTYALGFDSDKGRIDDRGKYLVVWRKIGGDWKVAADIYNSVLPAP